MPMVNAFIVAPPLNRAECGTSIINAGNRMGRTESRLPYPSNQQKVLHEEKLPMPKTLICLMLVAVLSCKKQETTIDTAEPDTSMPAETMPTATIAETTGSDALAGGTPRPPIEAPLPVPTETTSPSPRPKPKLAGSPMRETGLRDYVKVPVFYGTTRKVAGNDRKNVYGRERGRLQYGVSWVSIPRSHEPGELEEPSVRTLTFREDPARHVVLLEVKATPKDRWFADLNASIADTRPGQAFVFIHGYNTSFSDASRRTAQIKYDLGFAGPAILFSWPSHAKTSMYLADEANAEWSVPLLARFLVDLRRRTGATTIHVIAHSLGNRVLTRAVQSIDLDNSVQPKPAFTQVLMAAPDIDADVFRDELAPRMLKIARGVTLYGADDDLAIRASKEAHDATRAGEGGTGMPIIDGIDSIDVTGIDASFLKHSYIGSVSVLGDVAQMICEGKNTSDRLGITRRDPAGWRMVTSSAKRTPRPCRAL
jgi:esterase/lipase superfamily enzyme